MKDWSNKRRRRLRNRMLNILELDVEYWSSKNTNCKVMLRSSINKK
jgi:hypothetical protein